MEQGKGEGERGRGTWLLIGDGRWEVGRRWEMPNGKEGKGLIDYTYIVIVCMCGITGSMELMKDKG